MNHLKRITSQETYSCMYGHLVDGRVGIINIDKQTLLNKDVGKPGFPFRNKRTYISRWIKRTYILFG